MLRFSNAPRKLFSELLRKQNETALSRNAFFFVERKTAHNIQYINKSFFSTSPERSMSIVENMRSRIWGGSSNNKTELETQLARIAEKEQFTLSDFKYEIELPFKDWKTKIQGLIDKEQKAEMQRVIDIADVILAKEGMNHKRLMNLGRREKILLCVTAEKEKGLEIEPKDVNDVLRNYENMEFMHRILRYRLKNGKSIPKDHEGLQLAAEEDQKKLTSKSEKKRLRKKMLEKERKWRKMRK